MMVHFYISQDFSLAYCHWTIEEVAWLPFPKIWQFENKFERKLPKTICCFTLWRVVLEWVTKRVYSTIILVTFLTCWSFANAVDDVALTWIWLCNILLLSSSLRANLMTLFSIVILWWISDTHTHTHTHT